MKFLQKHLIVSMGLLSLLISLILYGNTIAGEFVYDDFQFVNSPSFHDIGNVFHWFTHPENPNAPVSGYRPLTHMTMNLHLALVGDRPASFHLVNIILDASATFLVFLLTRKLFANQRLALISALLFAFFPIHTENVANIKSRADILAVVLVLLAWFLLLQGKRWWSGLTYLFAVLAKELVLFVPILFFLVPLPLRTKPTTYNLQPTTIHQPSLWKRTMLMLPFVIAYIIYTTMRFITFGPFAFAGNAITWIFNPLGFADGATKFWTNWKITGMYIAKTFVPYGLSAGYQFNHLKLVSFPFASWEIWLGIVSISAMLLFAVLPKTRYTALGVGAVAFGAFFIPIPKVLFQGADMFAERWMYGPSVGLAIMAGYLIDRLIHAGVSPLKKPTTDNRQPTTLYREICGWSLLTCILLIYASITIPRNHVWRNQRALFASIVRDAPDNVHGYYYLARSYYKDGDLDRAEAVARTGYRVFHQQNPSPSLQYPELSYLLAQIAYHRSRYAEAETLLEPAIGFVGHATQIHGMYALVVAKQGKYQAAIDYILHNREKLNERDGSIALILGGSYYQLEDMGQAKRFLGWDEQKQDFILRRQLDNFLATGSSLPISDINENNQNAIVDDQEIKL